MSMFLTKGPVQPAGWVVFAVGIASLIGALLLNWRELLVLAIGCGAILLVSLAFVIGRSEIRLERHLPSDRVTVGDDALVELAASNSGSVRTSKQVIGEAMNGQPVEVPLPALAAGAEMVVSWKPSTVRRGKYRLGPARITKADPCRLLQRDVGQTGVDDFWVQPRVVPLPMFVGGLTKDVDGPTFDHSPAGDVAFHAIRPYTPGDDARHVHWMATARAGEMMVRHYVDNRLPYVSVVIDAHADHWATERDFNAAIDIAASIGVSSLDASQPGSVHIGDKQLMGSQRRSTRRLLLDDLTLVEPVPEFDLAETLGPLVGGERNTTIAVLLVGAGASAASLSIPATRLAQTCAVMIVRVTGQELDPDEATIAGRGVRYLEVADLDDFVVAMHQRMASS